MSSYPQPIAILPIFNSQEFNYSSSSLSISTADKRYLRLTGGILSGLLTANGNLNTPLMNLTGTGTPASFANIKLNAYDTINNYLQFNLQNLSSGSSASTDIVCTNNNGSDTAGFIDMGINSTTNTSTIGGASDAYLYTISDLSSNGGNLYLGTQSAKKLFLFANTNTPSSSNSLSWDGSTFNIPIAGTAGAPSLYFSTDTTSGLYRVGTNILGVSISGSQVANFATGGFSVTGNCFANTFTSGAGSVGLPAIWMNPDMTSGFYRPAANQIGISCSGSQVANFTSTGLAVTGKVSSTTLQIGSSATISLIQTGLSASSTNITAGSSGGGSVVFGVAFSSTPQLTATLQWSGGVLGQAAVLTVSSISTTGFSYTVYNPSGSTITSSLNVSWIAIA